MTILGTRPEIIRLSQVIPLLDEYADEHCLVHTGQNFTETLSSNFFEELALRQPDVYLGIKASSFGGQLARILESVETLALERRPDRVLILGDTNSGMAAIVASRLGVPVYHMEAGNRCYDDRVPEEINRRIIDHCSSVLLPYTERSRENLLREGFDGERIYVTGNPILEVLKKFDKDISKSTVLERLTLKSHKYFLVTAHRSETVDDPQRFGMLMAALGELHRKYKYPIIYSLHPRSKSRAETLGVDLGVEGVRVEEPFGFCDFVRLEREAFCVLSDSGTVQEETCILRVPSVTIRDVTERPETLECGSTILSGVTPARILSAVRLVTERESNWAPPPEYLADNVSLTVSRIVLGYRVPTESERRWLGSSSSRSSGAGGERPHIGKKKTIKKSQH